MKVQQPLVSIIIPVYNKAEYIEQTIQSALNQTWTNIEIIIVDDESTDNSLAIAKKYENETIHIFNQPNNGASSARNLGLKKAKGDYIQFLDADDLISPDKIESQLKSLENTIDTVATCSTIFFFDGEDHLINQPAETELDFLFSTNDPLGFLINLYGGNGPAAMVTIHSWLTPIQVINRAGFWDETLSVDDDGEYFCRVVLASAGITYTPAVFNYYRKFKNGINLSIRRDHEACLSMVKAITSKHQHLLNYNSDKKQVIDYMMAKHYWDIAIYAYPQYKDISEYCVKKAKDLGLKLFSYGSTKKGKLISKIFGWRFAKILSYFMVNLKLTK
ncbi:glycosyltransferase family 2 protein [Pedobacter sp. Hv1]|uniref:glycosyltransferase family 2 protein n=1 Tax=Pedobacter sp. Hv1 TaxID=1740090 RepID=UPI0006D8D29C|nr:glycosyltransferase family 2 protein [Pedobacter sp. Hv1]KQC02425.1 hypothetical protein AQF98_02265 [Pedobacter sp. Hv1]